MRAGQRPLEWQCGSPECDVGGIGYEHDTQTQFAVRLYINRAEHKHQ